MGTRISNYIIIVKGSDL